MHLPSSASMLQFFLLRSLSPETVYRGIDGYIERN